eukprot:6439376-Amphidinium_carterae.1
MASPSLVLLKGKPGGRSRRANRCSKLATLFHWCARDALPTLHVNFAVTNSHDALVVFRCPRYLAAEGDDKGAVFER